MKKNFKLKNLYEDLYKENILKDSKKNIIKDHKFNNLVVRTQLIHDLPGKDLRAIVDDAKKELGTACIFLFSEFDGKD